MSGLTALMMKATGEKIFIVGERVRHEVRGTGVVVVSEDRAIGRGPMVAFDTAPHPLQWLVRVDSKDLHHGRDLKSWEDTD